MFSDILLALTKRLYPDGRAYRIPFASTIEKIHKALILCENQAYKDMLSIQNSMLPDNDDFTEEDATDWERRLGLIGGDAVSLEDRKEAILRKMNHPGTIKARQHYLYLQKQLQDAGFDVYVHENRFFELGSWITKTPEEVAGLTQTDSAIHSSLIQHGQTNHGKVWNDKIVNSLDPDIDASFDVGANYRSTFFIGGKVLGTFATLNTNRMEEFRQLVLKVKPTQTVAFTFLTEIDLDGDVEAFLLITGISDVQIINALNSFVETLKAVGLWTKLIALYPYVGGSASAHSYNLKDVNKFQITWGGSITHDQFGVRGNGVDGHGKTDITPFDEFDINSTALGSYVNKVAITEGIDIGTSEGSNFSNLTSKTTANLRGRLFNIIEVNSVVDDESGLSVVSRENSAVVRIYNKGLLTDTSFPNVSSGLPNKEIFILSENDSSDVPTNYTDRRFGLQFVSSGLTEAEITTLNTAVNTFETALDREVYADSDVNNFLGIAEIDNGIQRDAINTLVTSLKGAGLWVKTQVLYPFIGGSATSHSYNLKDTTQFQITWFNGVVHSVDGVKGDGISAYGDTGFNVLNNANSGNSGMSIYTNLSETASGVSAGSQDSLNNDRFVLYTRFQTVRHLAAFGASFVNVPFSGPYNGLFTSVDGSSDNNRASYRQASLITSAGNSDGVYPNLNLYLLGRNLDSSLNEPSDERIALTMVHDALTAAEITTLSGIVTAYQTALSRNI